MKLPFTTEQFFDVIEKYNRSVFPFQWLIFVAGIGCLVLLHTRWPAKDRLIGSFLGILWIWTGIAYHFSYFSSINKAAFVFGSLFILQGLLILVDSMFTKKLVFSFTPNLRGYLGYFFILYGLIIYPVISSLTCDTVAKTIILGLPCPSTILTFGFFILVRERFPKYLLVIPSLWAVVGVSAALHIGVIQDLMIIIAAIAANIFHLIRKKERTHLS
jgi:hypothetical protein